MYAVHNNIPSWRRLCLANPADSEPVPRENLPGKIKYGLRASKTVHGFRIMIKQSIKIRLTESYVLCIAFIHKGTWKVFSKSAI